MGNSMKKRMIYAACFAVLLAVELLIGCFADGFVRFYLGDVLVIPLLCCLVRIVLPERPRRLALYVTGVGVLTEVLQAAELDRLLGVEESWLGVVLGSTFDWKDIVCYAVGGATFWLAERLLRKIS